MEKLTKVLDGITDKASADIAKPQIDSINEKMANIQKKMDALDDPTPEEQAALQKKYGKRMEEASLALMKATAKAGVHNMMNQIKFGH